MNQRYPFYNLSKAQKILLLGVLLGFGYIGATFIFKLHFSDSHYNFLGKKGQQRLTADKPVTQQFLAEESGLSEVKYSLGNVHLWPGEALRFELRDANCEQILATDSWTVFQPKSLIYTRFHFDRRPDSQNTTYCSYLVYTTPYNRKSSDAPHVNTTTFEGKSYTAKGKVNENESLYMRPGYREETLPENLWRLTERMSQYKPNSIKGAPLLLLMGVVFFGSIALSIWIILSKEKD